MLPSHYKDHVYVLQGRKRVERIRKKKNGKKNDIMILRSISWVIRKKRQKNKIILVAKSFFYKKKNI